MIKRLIFLALLMSLAVSCKDLDEDEIREQDLTLWGKFRYEEQLKMNGVYYSEFCDGQRDFPSQYDGLFILYRDGIAYGFNMCVNSELRDSNKVDNDFISQERRGDYNLWGCFDIYFNNVIEMQFFRFRSPSTSDAPVSTYLGEVLNDTTFILTKKKESIDFEDISTITFHFVRTEDKPDSSNYIIDVLGPPCCPKD